MSTHLHETNGTGLLEVSPADGPVDAQLPASPSKSITHRAILMGLIAPHVLIENPLVATDTIASLRLVHALGGTSSAETTNGATTRLLTMLHKDGARTITPRYDGVPLDPWQGIPLTDILRPDEAKVPAALIASSFRLHVEGPGDPTTPLPVKSANVDLANSGTTLRLGAALAALAADPVRLTGDPSLLTRPMAPLAAALQKLGARCTLEGTDGRPPVTVQGPLTGGEAHLEGGVSSQYISALLLAAHGTSVPVTLHVKGRPASAPYIRLTVDLLERLGGHVDETREGEDTIYHVPPQARLGPGTITVPGDWSSASFPLIAAAITGGRVRLAGLDPKSEQGDRVVLDALGATGCTMDWQEQEKDQYLLELTAPEDNLQPFDMDLNQTPDLLPPLAVLAARASGTSRFTGIAHARIKETDRIAASARGLEALGFDAYEEHDTLEVTGDPTLPLPPARIETHGDHRILMAFAVLGLTGPGPVRLTDPGCYHVSYPRFRLDLDTLGGATTVVNDEPTHSDPVKDPGRQGSADRPKTPTHPPRERP